MRDNRFVAEHRGGNILRKIQAHISRIFNFLNENHQLVCHYGIKFRNAIQEKYLSIESDKNETSLQSSLGQKVERECQNT